MTMKHQILLLMLAAAVLLPATAEAGPQVTGCPVDPSDYGIPVRRTFTDSKGHTADFQFALPKSYDPKVPMGMLMYLHGNDKPESRRHIHRPRPARPGVHRLRQ